MESEEWQETGIDGGWYKMQMKRNGFEVVD
jgi:hypothetical protein